MATPSPFPSQNPPPPSQNTPSQSQKNQSSNLYLVTFLATLSLLLFISCAIVLRSFILRRRYQRRLNDAMAAGMLLTPRAQGSKRKRFGPKPKMKDTWITHGGQKWEHIMPLCAQPVFVKRRFRHGQGPGPAITVLPDTPPPPPPVPEPTAIRQRLLNLFDSPRHSPPPTPPAEPDPDPLPTGTYKVRVEMLQVSVLIAMPSPTRTIRKNASLDRIRVHPGPSSLSCESADESDDEDHDPPVLPELVFGLTRVNYPKPQVVAPGGATTTPTPVDVAL